MVINSRSDLGHVGNRQLKSFDDNSNNNEGDLAHANDLLLSFLVVHSLRMPTVGTTVGVYVMRRRVEDPLSPSATRYYIPTRFQYKLATLPHSKAAKS
jgi:hypothetical protein